jgi:hypothetical protein
VCTQQYLFRRDDPSPAPWTPEGKELIKKLGIKMQYPEGYEEMKLAKEQEQQRARAKKLDGKNGTGKSAPKMDKAVVFEGLECQDFSVVIEIPDDDFVIPMPPKGKGKGKAKKEDAAQRSITSFAVATAGGKRKREDNVDGENSSKKAKPDDASAQPDSVSLADRMPLLFKAMGLAKKDVQHKQQWDDLFANSYENDAAFMEALENRFQ